MAPPHSPLTVRPLAPLSAASLKEPAQGTRRQCCPTEDPSQEPWSPDSNPGSVTHSQDSLGKLMSCSGRCLICEIPLAGLYCLPQMHNGALQMRIKCQDCWLVRGAGWLVPREGQVPIPDLLWDFGQIVSHVWTSGLFLLYKQKEFD